MMVAARGGRPDYVLLGVVATLLMVGLQALFSSSFAVTDDPTQFIGRQIIWAVLGLGVMVVTWRVPYRRWRRWSAVLLAVAVAMVVAVMIPGVGVNVYGAQRWLNLGPLPPFQPSEFLKLAVIVYCAAWLAERPERIKSWKTGLIPYFGVLGVVFLVVLKQPDLGTASVIGLTGFVLYFAAGAPTAHVLSVLGGVAAVTPILMTASYRSARLESFFDPWKDPLGNGFHIIQSLIAIGSGGLFGLGFGSSRQKFGYVPGSHTDAIFAIIGEELGLIGTMLVIGLFVWLGWRGFRVAFRSRDRFGALLAVGITSWLCIQAFINIGGITLTIPFTGLPLPFISSGGSALLVVMAAVGVLLNVSQHSVQADSADDDEVVEPVDRSRERQTPTGVGR